MFISKVLGHIWRYETQEYFDEHDKIQDISVETLYQQCKCDIMELNGETCLATSLHTLTVFETIGCSHQFNGKSIAGCSFCDWDSPRVRQLARLKRLSQLNEEKYAEIIRFSFHLARGEKCKPCLVEQLSVHNIFDEKQFPDAAFKLMFENDNIYTKTPEIGIISARADYVTSGSVRKWRNVFKKSLTIGIGVECGNEWIRNYWLNKQISNEQIINSVKIIKDNNAKICANILLGIPALNENISLAIFFDTCEFLLKEVDVDYILISPLISKKRTLGGFLEGHESAISYRMLLSAICGIQTWFPDYIGRITFSPDNLNKMMELTYGDDLISVQNLYTVIEQLGTVYTTNKYDFEVAKYKDELLNISSATSLVKNIKNVSEKIIDKIGNDREKFSELLSDDLNHIRMEDLKWDRWKY